MIILVTVKIIVFTEYLSHIFFKYSAKDLTHLIPFNPYHIPTR